METQYFIHIDSQNLAHYYSCACIKPSKYFANRKVDLQNKFDGFILLSNKRYSKEMDCALEIVLTKEEQSILITLNKKKDIFLFNNVIPITRVKKIFFKSDSTRDKITTLVNMSSGFIPEGFATVKTDNSYADYTSISQPSIIVENDLKEKIKKYDSLLGGFALMRLSGEEYMNYSENYFSTLSFFNTVIEAELINANQKVNDLYWDAFKGQDKFKLLYSYINKEITEIDLQEITKIENQKIIKSNISGIIDISSLERASYIIAILQSYGLGDEGRRNKIDGLILNNFKKDIKADKSEVVSLCYGLNRGYSKFTNKYRVGTIEKIVKFELNSKVDYYTIESIFQFAFNNKSKSSEFPYLDSWCPKFSKQKGRLKKHNYVILDKIVFGKKIVIGSIEWWNILMQFFFQKNAEEFFKPFIMKIYEKIKIDIEEDFQEKIEEKEDEINLLKNENYNLINQTKQIDNLKKQVASLKKELDSNIYRNKHSLVSEKEESYIIDTTKNKLTDYKKMFQDSRTLINELANQTKAAKAQSLIKKFNEKYPQKENELFPE